MSSRERPASGPAALPFTIRRGTDVVGMTEITSTHETVHGLLRFSGDALVLQWRTQRSTDRVGIQKISTDREIEPVREVEVPLAAVASARVRWLWRRWPPGYHLVVTGADLRAFEEAAGATGLQLDHPAELVLRIARGQRLSAREFAGEVELAVAERALRAAESVRLPP